MSEPAMLLLGRDGQVGWELQRTLAPLGRVTALGRAELDLANPDSIRQVVREMQPRVIVNAAAYTAVDRAEEEPGLAMLVNGTAPGILAEEALRLGARLVHYSTDYVFDGTKRSPYQEDDVTNPLSVYGRSKLAGEQAIREVGGEHLIFRTSWIYGARGRNFLLTMLRLAAEREELRVVADQRGAPTWSRDIAVATTAALRQRGANGLFHLSSTGETSWHEFAEAILADRDDLAVRRIVPITTPEFPTPAVRPAYSVLSNRKLQNELGISLPFWRESLEQVLHLVHTREGRG